MRSAAPPRPQRQRQQLNGCAQPRATNSADQNLRALGIPRLDAEEALIDKRPNIPLNELTNGRVERLLALVDRWIEDVRAHATEPETADET